MGEREFIFLNNTPVLLCYIKYQIKSKTQHLSQKTSVLNMCLEQLTIYYIIYTYIDYIYKRFIHNILRFCKVIEIR